MQAGQAVAIGGLLTAVVTGGTYLFTDASVLLLTGIGPVYFVLGAISAYRPDAWTIGGDGWSSGGAWGGLATAVVTWGGILLVQAPGPNPRFDVDILAFGMAYTAFVCGIVMTLEDESDRRDSSSEPVESAP